MLRSCLEESRQTALLLESMVDLARSSLAYSRQWEQNYCQPVSGWFKIGSALKHFIGEPFLNLGHCNVAKDCSPWERLIGSNKVINEMPKE